MNAAHVHTAQHSRAHEHTTAQHNCVGARSRDSHAATRRATLERSPAQDAAAGTRRRSTGNTHWCGPPQPARAPRAAAAAPGANKGGPEASLLYLAPPGVATSSSFSSRMLHVLRNTRNGVDPARLSHGSVTSVSRHAGANDSRCAVWVGSASAGFCHSAISSHSTRESSSCTPSM